MARPKHSDDTDKRGCIVPVRCTDAERAVIAQRAAEAQMTQSAYMRSVALSGSVVVTPSKADPALVQELQRVGGQLHALARAAGTSDVRPALAAPLEQLEQLLRQVMR
jgi:hypothetical protein